MAERLAICLEGFRVGHGTSGAATVLRPHRFQELAGLRRRTPLLVALAGRHSEKGGETGMTRGEYARDLLPPELDALPRVSRCDSRFVSCLQRWSRFPGR